MKILSHAFDSAPACSARIVSFNGAAAPPDAAYDAHVSALPTDGTVPDVVQLIPAGTFQGVDGRGPWRTPPNVAGIIAASKQYAGPLAALPIDYGHEMEVSLHGADALAAEAAGWITDLEERNGSVWGKVEWTADAAEKIKARKYRGISPVFYHDAAGVVSCIVRAGLTNMPNLRIKALNAQTQPHQETVVTQAAKTLLARLAALFTLPETSDEDAIIARCSAAVEAEGQLGKVAHGLSLAKSATADQVLTAVQAQLAAPDPAKFVAMAQYTAVSTKLEQLVKEDGERVVASAVQAGKITPGQKDHFLSWHAKDPTAAKAFLDSAPVILKPGTEARDIPATGAQQLTDADKTICAALGVSEADFLKNKEKE